MVPPEEIMVQLFRRRHSKMCNLDPLRVDSLKDPVDDPVLASRIDGLENDQDFHLVFGIEHFLKLSKFLVEFLGLRRFVGTFALKS
jgi:hypothetical protein